MKANFPSPPSQFSRQASVSLKALGGRDADSAAHAAQALEAEWQRGSVPSIENHWFDHGTDESLSVLAALVKADMRCRYARGEFPAVADYLKRFPGLRAVDDRVVSLVYEEFCLREEHGELLDPERFCDKYDPWRDSLASQLRYHRLLSQVVTPIEMPARFPEPGETFKGFHLLSLLGRGGVARVYLAEEMEMGHREVALKISPGRGKEHEIQGRLNHQHIVPVFSVTDPDSKTGLRGLCMPYVRGLSLEEVIRWVDPATRPRRAQVLWDALASQGRSEWEKGPSGAGWVGFPAQGTYAEGVAWLARALAQALEHAHTRGVLHRDVKPANVLLTFSAGPQLLDFNLAHQPHNAEGAEAALRGGTLPYMAPEQLEAFLNPECWKGVGEPADLYALGLLLCELLTGERPEAPDTKLPLPRAIRALLDQRSGATPSLRARNQAVPHALAAIADRCLAVDPAARYKSAGEVAEDLTRFLEHRPLRHAPNTSKAERTRNWTRRNRLPLAAAAAMLIGVTAVRYYVKEGADRAPHYVSFGLEWLQKHEMKEARASFLRALQLDPNLYTAYHGLAAAASQEGQLRESNAYLTQAIEAAERTPKLTGKRREEMLARLYDFRAAVARRLANEEQSRLTPEAFIAAKPYYDAGLRDLEHARTFYASADRGTQFNIEFETARIELGQGDVASKFDDYETAISHFTRSMKYLQQALALAPAEPGLGQAVRFKVDLELRLAQDGSILQQQREAARNGKAGRGSRGGFRDREQERDRGVSPSLARTVSLESLSPAAARN